MFMYLQKKTALFNGIHVHDENNTIVFTVDIIFCDRSDLAILKYVTRQLFGQFRADQFISKLSITVTVYQQI